MRPIICYRALQHVLWLLLQHGVLRADGELLQYVHGVLLFRGYPGGDAQPLYGDELKHVHGVQQLFYGVLMLCYSFPSPIVVCARNKLVSFTGVVSGLS